jgi:hypothetical protein
MFSGTWADEKNRFFSYNYLIKKREQSEFQKLGKSQIFTIFETIDHEIFNLFCVHAAGKTYFVNNNLLPVLLHAVYVHCVQLFRGTSTARARRQPWQSYGIYRLSENFNLLQQLACSLHHSFEHNAFRSTIVLMQG